MYYIVDVLYYFAVLLLLVNVSTIFNNISFGYKAIIIIIEKKKQDSQLIIVSTSISIASIFTIYTFMHSLHILKQTCDTYIIIDIVITELSLVIMQNYVKCPLKSNCFVAGVVYRAQARPEKCTLAPQMEHSDPVIATIERYLSWQKLRIAHDLLAMCGN